MGRKAGVDPRYWKYHDYFDHVRHNAYLKAKAQAAYRNEPWHLTINDWFAVWTPELWARRGRRSEDVCMVRKNTDLPFSLDNVLIVTRYWQICRNKKANQQPEAERQI